MGRCQIQLVLLAIYCSDSVLTLISSIVVGTHFRTRCIGHFRCNGHAVFVLILDGNITIFLFYRLFNFVINVNNAGCTLDNLSTFITLGSTGVNTVNRSISCCNSCSFMVSCIISRTNSYIRRIYNARRNRITLFILIINNNITIFYGAFQSIIVIFCSSDSRRSWWRWCLWLYRCCRCLWLYWRCRCLWLYWCCWCLWLYWFYWFYWNTYSFNIRVKGKPNISTLVRNHIKANLWLSYFTNNSSIPLLITFSCIPF
ncbi:hypothetical protein SSIN_1477 [Streptococcus sinensis]|uniref:Uncharacterized protein n=1 Tax=Streptococcus sinensis TaxID=176090 RepID=A0A0A0DFW5_9STRE|nr:hypothetical protein SSIN_1477 [Streptococcus sinensis]